MANVLRTTRLLNPTTRQGLALCASRHVALNGDRCLLRLACWLLSIPQVKTATNGDMGIRPFIALVRLRAAVGFDEEDALHAVCILEGKKAIRPELRTGSAFALVPLSVL